MAVNNPGLRSYAGLYIQASDANYASSRISNSAATEIMATYGLIPLVGLRPTFPEPKQPYRIDWKDEHGSDEYVDELFYEAQEVTVRFYIRAEQVSDIETVRANLFSDIMKGDFLLYSEYWGRGYVHVRFAGEDGEPEYTYGDFVRCQFSIKLRLNDPITEVVLNNGVLSPVS